MPLVFDRPGVLLIPQSYLEKSFGRQDVNRQSAVPQRHAQAQAFLAFEIDAAAMNGDFENPFERSLGHALRIQQAHQVLLHRKFAQPSALQVDYHRELLRPTDGDPELRIFQLRERLREKIQPHAEAILLEPISQFAQVKNTSVHCTAAPFRRIKTRSKPLKIRAVTPIDLDL